MSKLTRVPRHSLKEVGWTKAKELARLARREGQRFESAIWLHKAHSMETEEFRREVEKQLSGKDAEPWELLYFKVYKSQLRVIEQAVETAGLMLGTTRSRGYCLEMICADFLAGAQLEGQSPETLLRSVARLYELLPEDLKQSFSTRLRKQDDSETKAAAVTAGTASL